MKTTFSIAFLLWLAQSHLLAGEPAAAKTSLHQACRAGDGAAVRALLKEGADIEARDERGNTALMEAALHADVAVLELLLKAGAEVNATNQAGATALMRAATFEDKTRLLVTHQADVKVRSNLGNSPLILAARKPGSVRTVELLLDRGAEVNRTNMFGATALMAAVAAEDIDSVRLLLDRGADLRTKPAMDGDGFIWGGGRTPLMWAAFVGNEAILKLLLERGANVNDFGLVGGALAQAAWGGHAEAARLLLDAGAQIDQRDLIANYTPLHWAASSERSTPALVELLLTRGADPSAEGGQPVDNFLGATQTPLSLARKRGDTPIVGALLKAGAKDAPTLSPVRRSKGAGQAGGSSGVTTVAAAIQRALPPLQKTASQSVSVFLRHASKQDCVSCHQQQLPLAALSLAQSRQFVTDREAVSQQLGLLQKDISAGVISGRNPSNTFLEGELQATFHPEPAIFAGYAALDLRLEGQPASAATDALVHQLATFQHLDGHWSWNLPRPPIQASDIGATALAVHTIKFFGIPGRRTELESRVERARAWLTKASAESNEERTHQLLGLAWAGAESGARQKLAQELIREQRADGGWGQLAGLDSDAYATGQSLYALMEGGLISAKDPALGRGIDFLLRTQLADGTWHVRRRAHPFQPPMESGFPHGADSWISCAGTSWAVMALASSLDPASTTLARVTPVQPGQAEPSRQTASPGSNTAALSNSGTASVSFVADIKPLLERSCVSCHSGERAKAAYRMDNRENFLKGGNRGEAAVVPGQSNRSVLLHLVSDQVEDLEMPPVGKRDKFPALSNEEVARLQIWIAQGAAWPAGVTLGAQN